MSDDQNPTTTIPETLEGMATALVEKQSEIEQLRAANQVLKRERARLLATLRDLKADVIRRCEGALHV